MNSKQNNTLSQMYKTLNILTLGYTTSTNYCDFPNNLTTTHNDYYTIYPTPKL